jgi:hypothetical protein
MSLTLTFSDPTPTFLRGLADLIELDNAGESSDALGTQKNKWSYGYFEAGWKMLTKRCQDIDIEISKKPDGYEKTELLENLRVSGKSFGGILSSHGHMMHDRRFSHLREEHWPCNQYERDGKTYYQLQEDWQEYVAGLEI